MKLREWSSVLGISVLFFVMACAVVIFLLFQQEVVDGIVVDLSYTVESSATFVNESGLSGVVELSKDHFLMIEVNGRVSTYKVSMDTYLRALSGQRVFKMLCNPFSCLLME